MKAHAPDNTAPIPFAFSKELNEKGKEQWSVYVHFRRDRVTDFSLEATKPSLLTALNIVNRHLGRYSFYELQALHFDIRTGLDRAYPLSAG